MATTAAWRTSRIYSDPEGRGQRLNVVAAARQLGMTPRKFWRYQLRGWHQWQDERCKPIHLESLRMTLQGGQAEETYLESQVLELRVAMQSSPEERYRRMGRVNREMIARQIGMLKHSAQGNGNFDEWEKAGKLTPTRTKSPITGRRETTYPANQVDSLREERNSLTRVVLHRDGKDYLSTAEVCRRLSVTDQAIRWWTNGGITQLGGEEWDRIETPTLHGGKACWYEAGQVERIRVALQSWRTARLEGRACPETEIHVIDGENYLTPTAIQEGRGLTERVAWSALKRLVDQGRVKSERVRGRTKGGKPGQFVYHQQQIQAYLDDRAIVFDGVFETPDGRAFGLTRATQELKTRWHFDCSRWFLEQQIIKSPYLPEGKLHSLQLVPPSQHSSWCGREIAAVLECDLANLVASIRGATAAGNQLGPDWMDAVDITKVCGFSRDKERLFGSLLKKWRVSGELTNVSRLWWSKRGKRARVWVYFVPDVVRLASATLSITAPTENNKPEAETMPDARSDGARGDGEPMPQTAYPVLVEAFGDGAKQDMKGAVSEALDKPTMLLTEVLAELRKMNSANNAPNNVQTPIAKGQPGRPRTNDHFIMCFKSERERYTREDKTDKAIFLAYKKEHPEQEICKEKTDQKYLDACRAAIKEARKAEKKIV